MFRTEQSLKKEFLLIRVTTADKIGYKEQGILCLMAIVNKQPVGCCCNSGGPRNMAVKNFKLTSRVDSRIG